MRKAKKKALESRVEQVILPTRVTFCWRRLVKTAALCGSVSEVEGMTVLGVEWYNAQRSPNRVLSSAASNIYSASEVYYSASLKMAVGIRAKTPRRMRLCWSLEHTDLGPFMIEDDS